MRWCLPRSMLSSSLHLSVWVLGKFRIFNNYSTSARWKSALAMGMGLTRRVAPRSKLLSILVPRAWLSWLHGLETRGWSVKPSGPGDENGYNHLLFMAKPGWLVLSRSGFFTYGTDHMETVQAVYFCFGAKPANSNFVTKTATWKMWILSFFIAKLPEKLKRLKFYLFTEISKMDDEDKHSPSEVNIILNIWKLLMQKLKQESPKARRPKTIFNLSTNRKVQTQTATDMNTGSSPLHWS